MLTLRDFPHLNAALNASSSVLLIVGILLIKRGRYRSHAVTMILAALVSAAFLACYLIYHYKTGEQSTKQMSWIPPWLRIIYLVILVPHILLAFGMLPMIYLAFHRAIYWMLYHLFPSMKG